MNSSECMGGRTTAMKIKPRFQDFLGELYRGECYGIFIDDSGSPGLQDTPPNLHPQRKSWVAVVISHDLMPEVLRQFPKALYDLRRMTGATEFHFCDIYAGRGPFKTIDLRIRLALFEFMAYVFSLYKFPIIVQTLDPETLSDIRARGLRMLPDRVGPFDLRKPDDAALLLLLIRLEWFMQGTSTYPRVKARVFTDEGYKKNGTAIKIPGFETVFCDGMICFAKSSSILPIQLADFAAFALNRSQLIGGKEHRSSLDNRLLEILSSISWNYQNILKTVVSPTKHGPLMKRSIPQQE